MIKRLRQLLGGEQRKGNLAESSRALRLFHKASHKHVNNVLGWCDKYSGSDSQTWKQLVDRIRSAVTTLDENTNSFETTYEQTISRINAFHAHVHRLSTTVFGIAQSAGQSTERLKSSLEQFGDSNPTVLKDWLKEQERLDEQFLQTSQLVGDNLIRSLTNQYYTMSLLVMWIDLTMTLALSGAKTVKAETPLSRLAAGGMEELPEAIAGTIGLGAIVVALRALSKDKWMEIPNQIKKIEDVSTKLESLNARWDKTLAAFGQLLAAYQIPHAS